MSNEHWQESLSEETRQMIHDSTFKMWQKVFDEITLTPHERRRRDRQQLGKRLRLIAVDLELSGNTIDAAYIMQAAESLIGNDQ
jgi:hypothetical protein